MKRVFYVFLLVLVFLLSCCAPASEKPVSSQPVSKPQDISKPEEPLDLKGYWIQDGYENLETYQAGFINDSVIEIYWIMDGGETIALYWSGSYIPCENSAKDYSWESDADKEKTEYAIFASGDDKKSFAYKNDNIEYKAGMAGVTTTIKLNKAEGNVLTQLKNRFETVTVDKKELEILSSEYTIIKSKYDTDFAFVIELYNPNEVFAIDYADLTIILRDKDGKILKKEDVSLPKIAAGDKVVMADDFSVSFEEYDSVEFKVETDKDIGFVKQSGSGIVPNEVFEITNVSEYQNDYDISFTGEITNNSDIDVEYVTIYIVFRKDGQIVGLEDEFISDLSGGETEVFEISTYDDIKYDTYEIYTAQDL